MSETFFISDLHLGHKKILEFSPTRGGSTIDEHDQWIIDSWNSVVGKNDMVWVLGDVAFSAKALELISKLRGQKKLVRGNHDQQSTESYLKHFNNVFGLVKEKGLWLSHAPIHPQHLRGHKNIHGHLHHEVVLDEHGQKDGRYFNVSVEQLDGKPIKLSEILEKLT